MATTVQPLVVRLEPFYVLTTPFIPGVQPDPPLYTLSTPVIPGILDEDTVYTFSTPTIPGLELPLDAGPDDLDETFLPTTLSPPSITAHLDETFLPTTFSSPDHGLWHLDETYEATTFNANYTTPINFYAVTRESTVQELQVILDPGADQTVILPVVY